MKDHNPESDTKLAKLRRIFRAEALAHREAGYSPGELINMSPKWANYSYLFILVSFIIALLISIVGKITEYASGPAIVQLVGHTDVTVPIAGVLSVISVQSGQKVNVGDVLVQLYDNNELNVLKKKEDSTEHTIKAQTNGIISDLHIRPGQFVAPGQKLFSIIPENAKFSVLAMIPGQHRPLLRQNSKFRLELNSSRFSYLELPINNIENQVIGRDETRQFLGQELADLVPIPNSVVIVTAKLPTNKFKLNGQDVQFYSGLSGTAYIPIRNERIIFVIMPVLRKIFKTDE
jgi:Biotin carboxyl carrier protein